MKILIIGPSPEGSRGGMATVTGEIRDDSELNREFDITIFDSYIDGGKVRRLAFSVWAFLRFLLFGRGYDIYHIHTASYGSAFRKGFYVRAAKRWNKKVILHIHGSRFLEFHDSLTAAGKRKLEAILHRADLVLALSEVWKRRLDEAFSLTHCSVLENGIDMKRLQAAVTRTEECKCCFLFLGRLGERKGTCDLVNAVEIAARKVPEIRCWLAGDGEVDKFRAMAAERHLEKQVIVTGWADFDRKLELLRKVSVVVLPSYNEGLPMAILEGMACGKAIISTTVGAIPEVVNEQNGLLIRPGDVEGLADAMVKCCHDLNMVKEMSAENRKKIESGYSMKRMHGILAAYYREVAESHTLM